MLASKESGRVRPLILPWERTWTVATDGRGDWSDRQSTRISHAEGGRIWVRGCLPEEIVGKLSFVEAMSLLRRGEATMDQQAVSSAAHAFIEKRRPRTDRRLRCSRRS